MNKTDSSNRKEYPGIFIAEYTYSSLPQLDDKQRADVAWQLHNRYLTDTPSFEPTPQERKWGIQYIPEENTYWVHAHNKLEHVADLLRADPKSNKAVITIEYPNDPPCHQCFQFKIKDKRIEMTCYARSLDIDNGLPRDMHVFWYGILVTLSIMLEIDWKTNLIRVISAGAHQYIE